MKKLFFLPLFIFLSIQNIVCQDELRPETDPVITQRVAEWQELKFGFMMHWGIYSQWGVVESWSICNEPWIDRKGANYVDYVREYQALNKTFNPVSFNPVEWAELAEEAGMRYVVFTTKHHDGFCMYDTDERPTTASPTVPVLIPRTRRLTSRERSSRLSGTESSGRACISPRPTGIIPTTGLPSGLHLTVTSTMTLSSTLSVGSDSATSPTSR